MKIPTGCNSFDKILEGGLPSESITLIYGEPETGKTTMAIQCAVNCAKHDYKTLFVDADDTFSTRRLSQIAGSDYEKVAELIILMRPVNFREQGTMVDELAEYVSRNFGLVVVDAVTSLYRAKVSESPSKTFELNRELNRELASLAQLAKTHKLTVLLTSQVRSIFDEMSAGVEPVAPRVLKFWADTIIKVKPTENPQVMIAILEKNEKRSKTITCNLKIEKTGIHDWLN